MARQKDRRGVAHLLQARLGHGEHAELVDGAEAVLDGAQDPVAVARIALEIEHGIHHVFEHARPGERALLGHVPDQEHRDTGLLGKAHQLCGALADLRHRAGRRLQGLGIERLDGIQHHHLRPFACRRGNDLLHRRLGQQADVAAVDSEALRAQRDLLGGFLAGDIE